VSDWVETEGWGFAVCDGFVVGDDFVLGDEGLLDADELGEDLGDADDDADADADADALGEGAVVVGEEDAVEVGESEAAACAGTAVPHIRPAAIATAETRARNGVRLLGRAGGSVLSFLAFLATGCLQVRIGRRGSLRVRWPGFAS